MDLCQAIDAAYSLSILIARARRDGTPCERLKEEHATLRALIERELKRRGVVETTTPTGCCAMLRHGRPGVEVVMVPQGVGA